MTGFPAPRPSPRALCQTPPMVASGRHPFSIPVLQLDDVHRTYATGDTVTHALGGVSMTIELGVRSDRRPVWLGQVDPDEPGRLPRPPDRRRRADRRPRSATSTMTSSPTYAAEPSASSSNSSSSCPDQRTRQRRRTAALPGSAPGTPVVGRPGAHRSRPRRPVAPRPHHALRRPAAAGRHRPSHRHRPCDRPCRRTDRRMDSKSGQMVMDLLDTLNQERRTVVLITHDAMSPSGPSAGSASATAHRGRRAAPGRTAPNGVAAA